jgi:phosphatidylglycerol:prolipoprotein diacylglycerol transferase
MYPRIEITDSIIISSYSLVYIIAILAGIIIAYHETKRHNLPLTIFPPAVFWAILCGIIGAKIFHIIFSKWDDFLLNPMNILLRGGGWMYYGAEIGGIIGLVVYLKTKHLPLLRPLDIGAIVLLLAHAIGRVGCFLAGCCHGTACDAPWCATFPGMQHPVHPTQLYESIPLFIAFILVWIYRKKITIPGIIFSLYLIFYGSLRFSIDFYRANMPYPGGWIFTPSQYIAPVMVVIGIGIILYLMRKKNEIRDKG